MLSLRAGDVLVVHPAGERWEVRRETFALAYLDAAAGSVQVGERTWTLEGTVVPLALVLTSDADRSGAAWCTRRPLRPGALVQVEGAEEDVVYRPRLRGGAELRTGGEPLASLRAQGGAADLEIVLELAQRTDLGDYAAGLLVVCLWRLFAAQLPTVPGGAGGGP